MSDEFLDDDEPVGGDDSAASGGKKIGFMSGMLLQILKWAAIVIGAIIFIVTVVFISLRVMGGPADSTRVQGVEPEYATAPEVFSYWSILESMRGSTNDTPRKTFVIEPHIGITPEDERTRTELNDREIQIKDLVLDYFSNKSGEFLLNNKDQVRRDLINLINGLLARGEVKHVAFTDYQVVDF